MEDDDTEEAARAGLLGSVRRIAPSDDPSFWNRFAGIYDVATSSGNTGLEQAVDYIAGFLDEHDVVLDTACGTGAFACGIAPRVEFVAACDYAPKMVAATQKKVRRLRLENVACTVGNICALDFSDDSFDAAIAGNVLHLLDDPQTALEELTRVVRLNRTVRINTIGPAGGGDLRARFARRWEVTYA